MNTRIYVLIAIFVLDFFNFWSRIGSQLAFLSACCTAENTSIILIDENIYLASGSQFAGYPNVIASL